MDALSRKKAEDVHGLTVTDETWSVALDMARRVFGCDFTVDMFASSANRKCERFWSEGFTAGAEQVDALAVPSWEVSSTGCGCVSRCREVLWAFPPVPLLAKFWARAQTDGARGVCLVPFNSNAVWWPVAMDGAEGTGSRMHRLPPGVEALKLPAVLDASTRKNDTRSACAWTLVPFDFSRACVPTFHPVCAQARRPGKTERAGQAQVESLAEQRRRLMWFAAGLALEG